MENLIWSVILWALVFIIIPIGRIKKLWPVGVISFIWMTTLTFIFVHLGYYHFLKYFVMLAGVPPLCLYSPRRRRPWREAEANCQNNPVHGSLSC